MAGNDPVIDLLQEAAAARARGDANGALRTLVAGQKKYPEDARVLFEIGRICSDAGDFTRAAQALQRAAQILPRNTAVLIAYSRALAEIGKLDDALAISEASLNLEPNSIPALENASIILFKANRVPGLIKCLERLSALRPDETRYISDLARFYEQTQQFEEAYAAYRKIWDDSLATPYDYAKIGAFAFLAHQTDEAIPYLEKAIELEPDNAHSWMFLGRCHAVRGDKEAARHAFRKSIAANPNFINAYFFLSEIERFDPGDPAFGTLERLKSHPETTLDDKGALGFALGRMYQGAGDFDKAFENFEFGNRCTKDHYASFSYGPEPQELKQYHEFVTSVFSPGNRTKLRFKGSPSHKPVFIVGMPRSGTTLLEQIMSAHTEISTAGELREIPLIHRELMDRAGQSAGADMEAAALSIIDDEGDRYATSFLNRLEEVGGNAAMIIDKMPQNFEHLGLINVLFPNARIIHITRDPMDVGLSIYCNQFSIDWRYFQDLGDIGFYISEYRKLMAEWAEIIDLPILNIEYEDLVDNPERVARQAIEFCQQEWQPECLEFHRKRSEVHTASLMQVRKPVNRSAVGKWKAYERYLDPLRQALEA